MYCEVERASADAIQKLMDAGIELYTYAQVEEIVRNVTLVIYSLYTG
jgi:hypothetical protein